MAQVLLNWVRTREYDALVDTARLREAITDSTPEEIDASDALAVLDMLDAGQEPDAAGLARLLPYCGAPDLLIDLEAERGTWGETRACEVTGVHVPTEDDIRNRGPAAA